MNIEEARIIALSLPGVTEDMPFGDDNVVFRIEGKIFMCLMLTSVDAHFAIKLTPERNELLRATNEHVTPAWHWNKKHWSDIYYEQLNEAFVTALIHESYLLMLNKLPKAIKKKYTHQ